MYNISQAVNNMTFREKRNGLLEGRVSYQGERKSFYGHSKAECKNKARQYLEDVAKGEYFPDKTTLNDFMKDWLENYKQTTVEPSTYARMVSVYENQVKDGLGKKRITEITSDDIQSLINHHALGTHGKKPLSRSGLKKLKHLLGPCFDKAVTNGIIKKNPCDSVVIPKESNIVVKTKEQFSLSDEEIMKFKEAALVRTKNGQIKYRDALVLVLAIGLGVRTGELVTIKWSDIHWDENYVHIRNTLQTGLRGKEKKRIKDGTKTSKERMLPLNDNLKLYFRMLQKYDEIKGIQSEYVACTLTGTLHSPRNLSRSLKKLIERAGLPENTTLHTLRHTFGSSMIRNNVGIEIVSRLLGHKNIMVTYNKYVHVIKEQEAKAMTMVTII